MHFRVLAKSLSALGLFVRCPFWLFFGLVLFVCLAPLWPVLFRRLFQVTSHHLFHLSFLVYFSMFRDRWELPQGVRVTKNDPFSGSLPLSRAYLFCSSLLAVVLLLAGLPFKAFSSRTSLSLPAAACSSSLLALRLLSSGWLRLAATKSRPLCLLLQPG